MLKWSSYTARIQTIGGNNGGIHEIVPFSRKGLDMIKVFWMEDEYSNG